MYSHAHAVDIKLPMFSEASPATWFKIMEAKFHIKSITQAKTKFFYVLAALPTEVLVSAPYSTIEQEDYDKLREAIVSFYEKTKPELFEKLISATAMTGRPSAYLRELQQIAAKVKADEELVRHNFIKSLPLSIAPAVAAQKSLSLSQLGSVADELMPIHTQLQNLNLAQTSGNAHCNHLQNSDLDEQSNRWKPVQRSDCNNETIPIGLRPYHPNQRPKFCRSHLYYAEKAKYCKPWCRFPNKSGCRMQPSSRPGSRSSSQNRSTQSSN